MKIRLVYAMFLSLIIQKACLSQGLSSIATFDFQSFEHYLHLQNDSLYVINFWATWCVPCRKELPVFDKIADQYKNEKVKVLLVSLDFPSQISQSLIPFLNNNHIKSEVFLLNDPNSNAWINKVDPSWSGSIPATLIYNRSKRLFFEKELDYIFLNQTIHKIINL